MNNEKLSFTDHFLKGLKEYNLTYEEILNGGWKYCGGYKGRHRNYFLIACPDDDFPKQKSHCVCGHKIEENCYITNGDEILILGNCCIKKFIPKSGRTCEICGESHRNRKVNRCNYCRIGICDDCGKSIKERYKICYNCKFKGS